MEQQLHKPVRSLTELVAMLKERRVGFLIHEIMDGVHEFEPDMGPLGRLPMEYRVAWGARDSVGFLNAKRKDCLIADLEGTVTVGGLCEAARCRGTLDLRYFSIHTLRYTFDFEADGKAYRYVGDKVNIWPWNVGTSHTTCFGTLKERDSGKLVSRSVTYFRWWRAPAFVASLRLA
jgi:hypothetical protein